MVNYVNLSPENVYRFMNPFSEDGGVETWKMALTCLLVLRMVDIIVEVEAHCVAISKLVLEDHDYGCLGLILGKIISNQGSANAKF